MRRGWLISILLAAAVLLAALPPRVQAAEPDEQSVLAELFTLNRSLEAARAAIAGLAGQAAANGRQQAAARAERDRLVLQQAERQAWFVRRVRYMSEHGNFAPLLPLLGAQSLGDFFRQLDMIAFITRRDAALMRELQVLNAAVAEREHDLAARQAELVRLAAEQRTREAEVAAAITHKEAVLSGLKEQRAAMERRLAELEQVWAGTARPVLEALGASLRSADMAAFTPDATQLSLFPPGAVVRVSEATLNQFFGKQADLKGLTFQLAPGEISLHGDYAGISLMIRGGFRVQGKTALRYAPTAIKVGDFAVPQRITDEILASDTLDIELRQLVAPWTLHSVTAEQGFMLIRAGL
jgi:hypothetical protein